MQEIEWCLSLIIKRYHYEWTPNIKTLSLSLSLSQKKKKKKLQLEVFDLKKLLGPLEDCLSDPP